MAQDVISYLFIWGVDFNKILGAYSDFLASEEETVIPKAGDLNMRVFAEEYTSITVAPEFKICLGSYGFLWVKDDKTEMRVQKSFREPVARLMVRVISKWLEEEGDREGSVDN